MQSLAMDKIWTNIPHGHANRAWANWLGCRACSIREEYKKLFKHPRQYESSLIILPSSRRDQTWHPYTPHFLYVPTWGLGTFINHFVQPIFTQSM